MSSTRTLVMMLRPWIRRFTIIISAWWLRTSSKFTWEEVKTSTGKLGKWSTPKRVRIRPKHSAPSLSCDRRIKMHQSINHQDKSWAPHIACKTCIEHLRQWTKKQRKGLRFAIPMVWREPKDHWKALFHRKFLSSFVLILTQI